MDNKNPTYGVFSMKLTYEDKLAIFRRKQVEVAWSALSLEFGVREATLQYIVALMKRYGLEIIRKSPNRHYSTQTRNHSPSAN